MSKTSFKTLADGDAEVFNCRGDVRNITVIAGAGCTATVSRVDDPHADTHTSGTENQFSVSASTRTVTTVDWPYFRVSASGGSCRVAVV